MLRRLLAVATRLPRTTLVALALLAVAGVVAGTLVPVDGRLDRVSPSGSSTERAGELERASFGGDSAVILIRGDMVNTLRDPADLLRLTGLEGCLKGQVQSSTKTGPCAKIRDLDAVQSVQGPATFLNSSLAQLQEEVQGQLSALVSQTQAARKAAEAAAKKQGLSKAQITARGDAAEAAVQLNAIDQFSGLLSTTGIGASADSLTLRDKPLITKILFAKGKDGKLGPKRRLAWLIPTRNTALIQVNLNGNLSASKRAQVTKALQDVMQNFAFKLTNTRAELRFTGLAPATQSLSDTIRRSALVLGVAALVVMAGVLLLARRLRRRLLPVLVAAATLGLALLLLGIPTGALSLASVVALPVLVGLAVDQAVQAQLRLERRLHPQALRTLVIAGAAASASALALVASPFGVVRTVALAIAGAILVAIVAAAVASAAALTLAKRRAEGGKEPSGIASAIEDADDLLAGSPPVRGATAAGRWVAETAARIGRRGAMIALGLGVLVAVAGALLGSRATVQTDLNALVPADTAGAKELRTLRNEIGFASTVSIVVQTKQPGNPDLWRRLVAAQRTVTAGTDGRCRGTGLCTPLPLDELFGTTTKGALPTDVQVRDTLAALPQEMARGLVDADKGVVSLPFGVGTLDGAEQRKLVSQLRTFTDAIERKVPGVQSAGVSGLPAVVDASASALESPGRRAILAALALLLPALVLLATLRSPRRVLVALVPPAFALGWSEFALWLFGVPRTPLTAALGVLVAAVAVEFSVLLGERFAALRRVGVDRERAISATLRETGGAVTISAGATIAGFAVLGFAQIPVIAEFGVATALDLALVLLALVVIAPATWVLADRDTAAGADGGAGTRGSAPSVSAAIPGGRLASSSLARDGRTTVG
ncbi:MAG: MMPL family transporter [Solirubrobacteraceae bacterium]|nr:MMPL family transporter [Solirubrobacteraceae bacterium]